MTNESNNIFYSLDDYDLASDNEKEHQPLELEELKNMLPLFKNDKIEIDLNYGDYFEDNYENYNVNQLKHIFKFYKLNVTKITKNEMIGLLLMFEADEENQQLVRERKRLWKNIKELKNHQFFKKYISFEG